jgi:DNA replication and repair protein RecF
MILTSLVLQNFRSYSQKKFDFQNQTTVIVGQNTAGKTNLVESMMLLSSGKSVRAQKDSEMIRFGQDVAWVKGLVKITHPLPPPGEGRLSASIPSGGGELKGWVSSEDKITLEVMIAQGEATGGRLTKKYLVNGLAKSRTNFIGSLPSVLFRPEELDIIVDGPSMRRDFLHEVLEQVDREYRAAKLIYDKALRQRNALLDVAKETGRRNEEQFQYWDNLLITNGNMITQKREAFISFVNETQKDIMPLVMTYDKSTISEERLLQYKDAEIHAGVTLVGPQRDDFFIEIPDSIGQYHNVQHFGSRGQQRLVILQLKMLHIQFVENMLGKKPLLVLDDIFSELDERHIALVMERISGQQVIITTTHKEFIDEKLLKDFAMIELK